MSEAHDPLTPADCDLHDFRFMPLDVQRLRDSDLAALESPEACWAAVLLWCASWHQVPAASLPDDDRLLSRIAGYQRAHKEWERLKSGALRGWVRCTDGRLYHPVVAEKAREAWRSKLKQRWDTECARIRKANQRNNTSIPLPSFEEWMSQRTHPATVQHDKLALSQETHAIVQQDNATMSQGTLGVCPSNVPLETASKGQGEGQGQGQGEKKEEVGPTDFPFGGATATRGRKLPGPIRWDDDAIKPCGQNPKFPPDHPENVKNADRPTVNGCFLDWTFDQAMEVARMDPARSTATWKPVVGWLKEGIEPETILAAIRKRADREGYYPPASLQWFDEAVRQQHGRRAA